MTTFYQLLEGGVTLIYLIIGTWALFVLPGPEASRLLRRFTPQTRRTLFRLIGCVFCTWGFARLFSSLWVQGMP